jgi:hypothetical protein
LRARRVAKGEHGQQNDSRRRATNRTDHTNDLLFVRTDLSQGRGGGVGLRVPVFSNLKIANGEQVDGIVSALET